MESNIVLSQQQLNQIASSILLKDIQDFIGSHKKEYEQFLIEEKNEKQSNKLNTEDTINNLKIQKIFNTTSIWGKYMEETKINSKGMD